MTLEEFREELEAEVSVWANADLNFSHSAFVDVAVHYLEEAGEVADFETSYYRGFSRGRHSIGIDGYAFDSADSSLRLFIAVPHFSTESTIASKDIRSQFGQLRAFVEEAIAGNLDETIDENSPAREISDELRRRYRSISRLHFFLLTDALNNSTVKDWPAEELEGVPLERHIWDASRLFRVHSSQKGQEDLVVDFRALNGRGIPSINASARHAPYNSFLCVVPGPLLADMYDKHGSRLLEGNVRAFLSVKGKINKGIRNTLLHEPEMFFVYNNGIAATASEVTFDRGADGQLHLTSATDFQIVNGGQTTASLSATRRTEKRNLEDSFVPMKLTVVGEGKSEQIIPLISRFANSQNKVSDVDFFSNAPFHQRIEKFSRRLWAPAKTGSQHETRWFYERARGQFVNEQAYLTSTQRKRFIEAHPKEQLITKTDLAKSENTWDQVPHIVSRGAQSSFLHFAEKITARWDEDQNQFGEAFFRDAVARLIVFRATERLVSGLPWYSGGYRANIVTYAIAKIVHEVDKQSDKAINLRGIWGKQAISTVLGAELALASALVFELITNPRSGQQNVTQWAKTLECWTRVKSANFRLSQEFVGELISFEEVKLEDRDSRALQQIDAGIDAQTWVVALGVEYWVGALAFANSRGNISPDDERLLKLAGEIGTRIPSEKQSKRLIAIQKHLEHEGLRPPHL